ncbi:inhibitor of Bruton tyrosine kinase [Anopheles nili]|uniref:inhibitor of Bruton tyrosine kinase n=1 Tax=Anopheles nili TaxID=185578 RepID=UPI00237BE1B6|nr:inhibitor of Bruton tyrosine kinase [Anopheles nili]
MYTISDYDYECTKKCRLVSHGNAITAALTKRAITDELLAAFIAKTCRNFAHILDDCGRSALHMAASVGRYAIVEWLINQGASLSLKDHESGHTALHRAMYYGSVGAAVLLVKHGAALDAADDDFVNPVQLCSNVSEQRCTSAANGREVLGPELMVWGQNKNYNLGLGDAQDKGNPESMEFFRKTRTTIRKLEISSYHSVFLTHRLGELYTVGHGFGGRLGLGMEDTIACPMKVPVPLKDDERIVDVSAAKHHTLILTDASHIYSCGENTHCQLGIKPPPPKLLTFKEITGQSILAGKTVKRVIARDYHSIAVLEGDLYVWGLNGGQFGLKRDPRSETIMLPKPIPLLPEGTMLKDDAHAVRRDTTIKLVESCNAAVVVYTVKSFLHIFYGFKVKTYKKPLMEKIECLSVAGGELQTTEQEDVHRGTTDLRVLVFTASRNIYIWYEDSQQFVRCLFAQSRNLEVEKIRWCSNNALVLLLGNLYQGTITNKLPRTVRTRQQSDFKETHTRKELCETLQSRIELRRIRNLSNVVDFACDAEGENYAALVENTRRCFCVPELVESNYDYGTLLADASEMDGVHDVVLYVEGQPFASHRFILYHRSEVLRELLQQHPEQQEFDLKEHGFGNMTIGAFRLVMRYLYTNQLISRADVERLVSKPVQTGSTSVDHGAVKAMSAKLKTIIDQMQLTALTKSLKTLQTEPPIEPFPMLRHDSFPELYDLTIELQDDKRMRAHKCVLVARLDYFSMMFTHGWTERRTTVDLRTVPREYMDVIVPFLYDNDYGRVRRQRYSENFLLSMVIICDQFLIEELKSIFETIVSQRVHLRNVGELLEFGYQYNCELLKSVCMQFISVNFARLLEWRLLDGLEPTVLLQIDHFYKEFFRLSDYRTITPFAVAIGDEELEQFVTDFRVDLDHKPSDRAGEQTNGAPELGRVGKVTPRSKHSGLSKLQREKRNYEKEAMAYLERLVLEEAAAVKERKISASKTAQARTSVPPLSVPAHDPVESADERPSNKPWQTVVAAADAKRKSALTAALRVNELMKEEARQPLAEANFSSLRTVLERSPTAPQLHPIRSPDEGYESAGNVPRGAINLADFAIQNGNLSQKQRKRLNSEKSRAKAAEADQAKQSGSDTPVVVPVANPWKNINSIPAAELFKIGDSPPLGSPDVSGPTGSRRQRNPSTNVEQNKQQQNATTATGADLCLDASAKKQRQRQSSTRCSVGEKDFNEILAEERRQKRYIEMIKSKSLAHTQIEERAIEELRAFYNVDQVFDESITVERYRPPLLENAPNFAVWQYQ